jgi:hypothetical protein
MNSFVHTAFHGLERTVEDGFHGAEQIFENIRDYEIKFDDRKPGVSTKAHFQAQLLASNNFLLCRKTCSFMAFGGCLSPSRILLQLKYPR